MSSVLSYLIESPPEFKLTQLIKEAPMPVLIAPDKG